MYFGASFIIIITLEIYNTALNDMKNSFRYKALEFLTSRKMSYMIIIIYSCSKFIIICAFFSLGESQILTEMFLTSTWEVYNTHINSDPPSWGGFINPICEDSLWKETLHEGT